MLTTRPHLCRAARVLSRGGFTLVELLVVIGIIAILAGVALGPITNGIKKAKQSSGVQSAHALGLAMYSAANDNSQTYPDTSGGATASGSSDLIAASLLAGGYVTDATIFYLSADSAATKVTSANNTAGTIGGSGVTCWDFLGNAGNGVNATQYTFLPILWSTLNGGTEFTVNATAATAMTGSPVAANPFGTDGVAIFYINNSAAFVNSTIVGTTYTLNMVSSSANLGGAPATYKAIQGK